MTTSTAEAAPARRAKAEVPDTPAVELSPPVVPISLDDYLSREPRLANRPEMMVAFGRACQRDRLMRAPSSVYAAKLVAFERGA